MPQPEIQDAIDENKIKDSITLEDFQEMFNN